MRIIDSHTHLINEPKYLDNLLHTMDKFSIEKCCMSGLGKIFGFASNGDVKQAFKNHPDRIIGTFYIRPGIDKAEKIKQAYEEGFKMIKVTLPRVPYDDPICFPLWAKALEYNIPVLFHTGTVSCRDMPGEMINSWYMCPSRIEPVTREFPELKVIVAHLGVHWNADAAELARMRPNAYVDLTGEPDGWRIRADKEGMDKWLWWPGAFEKVVFGTDVHYSKIGQIIKEDIARLDKLGIPQQTREKIFSQNIIKLLGLKL